VQIVAGNNLQNHRHFRGKVHNFIYGKVLAMNEYAELEIGLHRREAGV